MDNVCLLRSLYDAFGRGDIPTVLEAMSQDIRWSEAESNPYMPSGEAWVGPDAVLNNLFMRIGAEWDGFAVHPRTFHGAGDSVIVEARYCGTFTATGKSMDAQVCHVWDVRNGKVARFQQYVDNGEAPGRHGSEVGNWIRDHRRPVIAGVPALTTTGLADPIARRLTAQAAGPSAESQRRECSFSSTGGPMTVGALCLRRVSQLAAAFALVIAAPAVAQRNCHAGVALLSLDIINESPGIRDSATAVLARLRTRLSGDSSYRLIERSPTYIDSIHRTHSPLPPAHYGVAGSMADSAGTYIVNLFLDDLELGHPIWRRRASSLHHQLGLAVDNLATELRHALRSTIAQRERLTRQCR